MHAPRQPGRWLDRQLGGDGVANQADAAGVDELGASKSPSPPWQGESPRVHGRNRRADKLFHRAVGRLNAAKDRHRRHRRIPQKPSYP